MKNVLILGAGESGLGAALLAKRIGDSPVVSDNGKINEKAKNVLLNNGIRWEEGGHSQEVISNVDLVVKSPGIADSVPVIRNLINQKIPIISEIEYGFLNTKSQIIGVTGTNGKSTTSKMTFDLLKAAGENVCLAGNYGDSFAKKLSEGESEIYVLELSSFQLDGIEKFKPKISMLLNISEDHLDRYESFESYIESKFRIIENQDHEDYFIYDFDDPLIRNKIEKINVKPKMIPFSAKEEVEEGAFIRKREIVIRINNKEKVMSTLNFAFQENHNIKNAMASSLAASLLNINSWKIRESFENFEGIEHRMEEVLKIQGVRYINDSKATNVNAAFYALNSIKTPIIWLAGGEDKGNEYNQLVPAVSKHVKSIICIGKDNDKITNTFSTFVDEIVEEQKMDLAVLKAYRMAERGDTVLLSPACASFDFYNNYEERGSIFKKFVRLL